MKASVYINLINLYWYKLPTKEKKPLLSVLARQQFAPNLIGDPPRIPFSLAACAARMCNEDAPGFDIYFTRKKAPAWWGTFASTRGIVEFSKPVHEKLWAALFVWANDLADALHPQFGVCYLPLPPEKESISPDEDQGALHHPGSFRDCGLAWFGTRTYLGRSVVKLLGRKLLNSTGAVIAPRSWGLIVDLVEKPWTAPADLLIKRQREVMEKLLPSGLFADYSGPLPTPGKKWVPLPS
jgi:hypothetical protein